MKSLHAFFLGATLGLVMGLACAGHKKPAEPVKQEEPQVDQAERDKSRQVYMAELFQFYESGCELPFKEDKKIDGTPEEFCKSKAFDFMEEIQKEGLFK